MRRRDFTTLLAGAVAWPRVARAQQTATPMIGYLASGSPEGPLASPVLAAFRQGLKEAGYVEGENVAIEYRWARGQYDRLPALAANLVARRVAVLFAQGGPPALAAKSATSAIPIVFMSGLDPVAYGLVASMNRPGNNATGAYLYTASLETKRLELLRALFPNSTVLGVILNSTAPSAELQLKETNEAAHALGFELRIVEASSETGINTAFATLAERHVEALLVGSDPFFLLRRDQIIALAASRAVPAMYGFREYATAGGLMSYGASIADATRQAGVYTGRVLKGEKPAELPVQQSTKVELVINLKTAKTLGLTFPLSLLGRADEVIE